MRVQVDGLHKSYPTPSEPLVVLDDLSLELASGESLAITGPSGCGKSTLLHILGTLDTPDRGSVKLGDADPFSLGEDELAAFRNESVGFVFQDHFLLPQCSVLENVLIPTLATKSEEKRDDYARELLDRVGLADRLTHRPAELSGGERQRAAIARALVQKPGLVLCDEPTGNLDGPTAEKIAALFLELHDSLSVTLVVVTHSIELAGRFGRRVTLRDRQLAEVS